MSRCMLRKALLTQQRHLSHSLAHITCKCCGDRNQYVCRRCGYCYICHWKIDNSWGKTHRLLVNTQQNSSCYFKF
jgi:hypothetical protein